MSDQQPIHTVVGTKYPSSAGKPVTGIALLDYASSGTGATDDGLSPMLGRGQGR